MVWGRLIIRNQNKWNQLSLCINPHLKQTTFVVFNKRHYSIIGSGIFRPKHYTKYRITKPFSETSTYDDLILSEPSRNDLVTLSKNDTLFLRFLKLVTDEEGRQDAFKQFVKRCETGLIVEKDVYLKKTELLQQLWENGYSTRELHAYDIAFPNDYFFHYPELAVLFNLLEEDCYKFCMRIRSRTSDELIEIKDKPTSNAIASYGVISTGLWFGLQNNVLGNVWMMVKTWPFFAVFYMLASHFQKKILGKMHSYSINECSVAQNNRLDGEDHVYSQMKKYDNDSRCLDYLEFFKPSVQTQIEQFKTAYLYSFQDHIVQSITRHLLLVQQQEKMIEHALQDIIVNETVEGFRQSFATQPELQQFAFNSAVEALSAPSSMETSIKDPVGEFFKMSFQAFEKQEDSSNPVVNRVNHLFYDREHAFLNQFTVTIEEYNELKKKAIYMLGANNTINQCDNSQKEQLEKIFKTITSRVGLESFIPNNIVIDDLSNMTIDDEANKVLKEIKQHIRQVNESIKNIQLEQFLSMFR